MRKDFSFGLPLKQNFTEYICLPRAFNEREVEKMRAMWQEEESVKAEVSGDGQAYHEELRRGSLYGIENNERTEWLYQRLAEIAIRANNQCYWFDLLGFHEELQMMRYSEGDFFDWHLDFGNGFPSSRKLSLTVQLSNPDDYEGGDLQFKVNQKEESAARELGSVIIFPSFIIHRVTPVTKGERQSIVGWVTGPPYR